MSEITIPKELREFPPAFAKPTWMGLPMGAKRQYRHGNLHIREYDDEYRVHVDEMDPRHNPVGHLLLDAPEVLFGANGAAVGARAGLRLAGSGPAKIVAAAAGAAILGVAAYLAARHLKR